MIFPNGLTAEQVKNCVSQKYCNVLSINVVVSANTFFLLRQRIITSVGGGGNGVVFENNLC